MKFHPFITGHLFRRLTRISGPNEFLSIVILVLSLRMSPTLDVRQELTNIRRAIEASIECQRFVITFVDKSAVQRTTTDSKGAN